VRAKRAPPAASTLFLLLGGDRLPLRARRLARELLRPRQQERGRRIFGCNARELLGGGGEVARAITVIARAYRLRITARWERRTIVRVEMRELSGEVASDRFAKTAGRSAQTHDA